MKYRFPVLIIAAVLIVSVLSCTQKKEENLFDDEYEAVTLPADIYYSDDIYINSDENNTDRSSAEIPEIQNMSMTTQKKSHNIEGFKSILQNPELPTGCEVTSLTMVLNYLGYDISKTSLANNYLPKASLGKADFSEAFIGNPASDGGYGCFAPVIVKTAQKYLIERTMEHTAWDLSGTEFRDLFEYIDHDIPVIVWTSMNLMDVSMTEAYYDASGNSVTWYGNEHCMVICGYNEADNTVTAADPLKGMMKYDIDRFETIYNTLEKQAVIIN